MAHLMSSASSSPLDLCDASVKVEGHLSRSSALRSLSLRFPSSLVDVSLKSVDRAEEGRESDLPRPQ